MVDDAVGRWGAAAVREPSARTARKTSTARASAFAFINKIVDGRRGLLQVLGATSRRGLNGDNPVGSIPDPDRRRKKFEGVIGPGCGIDEGHLLGSSNASQGHERYQKMRDPIPAKLLGGRRRRKG